jgi:hypothetical protein
MKFSAVLVLFLGLAAATEMQVENQAQIKSAMEGPCVYLDETQAELDYQVDMFSRTLDSRHWTNVGNVAKAMKKAGKKPYMYIHTWELYDKSFSFPRVRRYGFVQENMDMLEHFQDNLNQNLSNSQHMSNFLRVANTVRGNLNGKYHDGEFDDPSNHDPKNEDDESAANKVWTKAQ